MYRINKIRYEEKSSFYLVRKWNKMLYERINDNNLLVEDTMIGVRYESDS